MRILYATDGADPAVSASTLLERMVHREGVELVVLSVVPEPWGSRVDEVEAAGALVERAVGRLRTSGFEATGRTRTGSPAAEIMAEADRSDADIIVMGAGNKRWLDRLLLGSESTRVLHGAGCSVLIVHEPPDQDAAAGILVATDGSADAEHAIGTTLAIADPGRCDVSVLSVAEVPYPTFTGGPGVAYATTAFNQAIEEELTRIARERAEEAAVRFRDAGFRAEPRWLLGAAAIRVLEEARDRSSSLVVAGSRGHGAVERAIVGSVSERIVRHAPAALIARRD